MLIDSWPDIPIQCLALVSFAIISKYHFPLDTLNVDVLNEYAPVVDAIFKLPSLKELALPLPFPIKFIVQKLFSGESGILQSSAAIIALSKWLVCPDVSAPIVLLAPLPTPVSLNSKRNPFVP